MVEYRTMEYAGVKGFIIESRGHVIRTGGKISKSAPPEGVWACISNWSTPEARDAALKRYETT